MWSGALSEVCPEPRMYTLVATWKISVRRILTKSYEACRSSRLAGLHESYRQMFRGCRNGGGTGKPRHCSRAEVSRDLSVREQCPTRGITGELRISAATSRSARRGRARVRRRRTTAGAPGFGETVARYGAGRGHRLRRQHRWSEGAPRRTGDSEQEHRSAPAVPDAPARGLSGGARSDTEAR